MHELCPPLVVVDQIDQALSDVQDSVDVASKYLKSRIKYHREVTSYLNKRAQIGTPDSIARETNETKRTQYCTACGVI